MQLSVAKTEHSICSSVAAEMQLVASLMLDGRAVVCVVERVTVIIPLPFL